MPKLTVIMPTLNQGRFIERAIRSVLDQGLEDLEFIVVDGGSTDGSVEVLRRYEERLTWWVSEPDHGQVHALWKGLDRATGEVVAYLNSDDYYLPGAFGTVLSAFERCDSGWVAGAARNIDHLGRPTHDGAFWIPKTPEALEPMPRGRHWWLLRHWAVPQPSSFWRRELFERHGRFRLDMDYAFDVEFMLRLVLAGERPLILPDEVLSVRFLHPGAKSFDTRPWHREYKLIRRLHGVALTPRERLLLRVGEIIWPPRPVAEWLHRTRTASGRSARGRR
jgi:glycosyltransferase involved in cell wall biosynthesis